MAVEFQVLSLSDLDEIFNFANQRLVASIPDEQERTFALWAAKWRREALEHYLKLGWSFIARENGATVGFFLAQPFLFFRGQTQTLWVEHIEAIKPEIVERLIEVAVRVAREKHLQRVLFSDSGKFMNELSPWRAVRISDDIAEVMTTKG